MKSPNNNSTRNSVSSPFSKQPRDSIKKPLYSQLQMSLGQNSSTALLLPSHNPSTNSISFSGNDTLQAPSNGIQNNNNSKNMKSSNTKLSNYIIGNTQPICLMKVRPLFAHERMVSSKPKIVVLDKDSLAFASSDKDVRDDLRNLTQDKLFRAHANFGETDRNLQIANELFPGMLDQLLIGVSNAIMSIGAEGSGKSHTIFGSLSDPGLLIYFAHSLFKRKEKANSEIVVKFSVLKFDDDFTDVLSPITSNSQQQQQQQSHLLFKNTKAGACMPTATKIRLETIEDFFVFFRLALRKLTGKCFHVEDNLRYNSKKNPDRNHTIVSFKITNRVFEKVIISQEAHAAAQINTGPNDGATSANGPKSARAEERIEQKLYESEMLFVDTDHFGLLEQKEQHNLQQSMITLENIMQYVYEINKNLRSKATHLPFDDSKLTSYLRRYLYSENQITFIGTLSPFVEHIDASMKTARIMQWAYSSRNSVTPNITIGTTSYKQAPAKEVSFVKRIWQHSNNIGNEIASYLSSFTLRMEDKQHYSSIICDVLIGFKKNIFKNIKTVLLILQSRDSLHGLQEDYLRLEYEAVLPCVRSNEIREIYLMRVIPKFDMKLKRQLELLKPKLVHQTREISSALSRSIACYKELKQSCEDLNNTQNSDIKQTHATILSQLGLGLVAFQRWAIDNALRAYDAPDSNRMDIWMKEITAKVTSVLDYLINSITNFTSNPKLSSQNTHHGSVNNGNILSFKMIPQQAAFRSMKTMHIESQNPSDYLHSTLGSLHQHNTESSETKNHLSNLNFDDQYENHMYDEEFSTTLSPNSNRKNQSHFLKIGKKQFRFQRDSQGKYIPFDFKSIPAAVSRSSVTNSNRIMNSATRKVFHASSKRLISSNNINNNNTSFSSSEDEDGNPKQESSVKIAMRSFRQQEATSKAIKNRRATDVYSNDNTSSNSDLHNFNSKFQSYPQLSNFRETQTSSTKLKTLSTEPADESMYFSSNTIINSNAVIINNNNDPISSRIHNQNTQNQRQSSLKEVVNEQKKGGNNSQSINNEQNRSSLRKLKHQPSIRCSVSFGRILTEGNDDEGKNHNDSNQNELNFYQNSVYGLSVPDSTNEQPSPLHEESPVIKPYTKEDLKRIQEQLSKKKYEMRSNKVQQRNDIEKRYFSIADDTHSQLQSYQSNLTSSMPSISNKIPLQNEKLLVHLKNNSQLQHQQASYFNQYSQQQQQQINNNTNGNIPANSIVNPSQELPFQLLQYRKTDRMSVISNSTIRTDILHQINSPERSVTSPKLRMIFNNPSSLHSSSSKQGEQRMSIKTQIQINPNSQFNYRPIQTEEDSLGSPKQSGDINSSMNSKQRLIDRIAQKKNEPNAIRGLLSLKLRDNIALLESTQHGQTSSDKRRSQYGISLNPVNSDTKNKDQQHPQQQQQSQPQLAVSLGIQQRFDLRKDSQHRNSNRGLPEIQILSNQQSPAKKNEQFIIPKATGTTYRYDDQLEGTSQQTKGAGIQAQGSNIPIQPVKEKPKQSLLGVALSLPENN